MSSHPSTRRRRFVVLAATAAATTALLMAQAGPAAAQPGKIRNDGAKDAIAGNYIVVLKDSAVPQRRVAATTDRLAAKHNASVGFRYQSALRGFSAQMSRAEAEQLASDPSVDFVEQDRAVKINATQAPTPSWGLDRLDQRDLPLNNSYTYTGTGGNVTAYVIDTGIRITHNDFGGRAIWGANFSGDGNNSDCNGHGTHVAGTIGGTAYGVAKGARLVAVKVLNCAGSGSFSGVVAGIDWVTANHTSGAAVADMSLGASGLIRPRRRRSAIRSRTESSTGSRPATTMPTRATTRRPGCPRRSPSTPRREPMRAPRSRTTGPAPTSSLRGRRSRRPGTPATPRPTRSAAHRWPRRTSSARRP